MAKTWDQLEHDSNETDRKESLMIVCGLPNSGNRALLKALQATGFDGTILHGTPELPEDDEDHAKSLRRSADRLRRIHRPGRTAAIIIVRAQAYREMSYRARRLYHWHHRFTDVEHTKNMMAVLAELEIPTLLVSYEGLVEMPGPTMKYLVGNLVDAMTSPGPGLPIPKNIASYFKDANAKYRGRAKS